MDRSALETGLEQRGGGQTPTPRVQHPTPAQFFPPYPAPFFLIFFRVPPPKIQIFFVHPGRGSCHAVKPLQLYK